MIDPEQFRRLVVQPTLHRMGMWSQAAENLLVGTAVKESGLRALEQEGGPALGVYQVEPASHADLFVNWYAEKWVPKSYDRSLITDLAYATIIARLIYYRRPEPLPAADDIDGLAAYWKQHYNTPLGKGTPSQWSLVYREYCR